IVNRGRCEATQLRGRAATSILLPARVREQRLQLAGLFRIKTPQLLTSGYVAERRGAGIACQHVVCGQAVAAGPGPDRQEIAEQDFVKTCHARRGCDGGHDWLRFRRGWTLLSRKCPNQRARGHEKSGASQISAGAGHDRAPKENAMTPPEGRLCHRKDRAG